MHQAAIRSLTSALHRLQETWQRCIMCHPQHGSKTPSPAPAACAACPPVGQPRQPRAGAGAPRRPAVRDNRSALQHPPLWRLRAALLHHLARGQGRLRPGAVCVGCRGGGRGEVECSRRSGGCSTGPRLLTAPYSCGCLRDSAQRMHARLALQASATPRALSGCPAGSCCLRAWSGTGWATTR